MRVLEARLLGKQAAVLELMGRYDEALEACDRGLARLEEASPTAADTLQRARLRSSSAPAASTTGGPTPTRPIGWLERAAADAEAAGDRARSPMRTTSLDAALTDLGRQDGLPVSRAGTPIYEELGDLRGLGVVLSNLGIHALLRGPLGRVGRAATRRAGRRRSARRRHRRRHPGQQRGRRSSRTRAISSEAEPSFDVDAARLPGRGLAVRRGARRSPTSDGPPPARAASARRTRSSTRRSRLFEELEAERFISETRARSAECLLFEGRYVEALALAPSVPRGGPQVARRRARGAPRARRSGSPRPGAASGEAPAHLEESLRLAREQKAEFEVALTLRAMADVRASGRRRTRARRATRSSSGSASSVPKVPLPKVSRASP